MYFPKGFTCIGRYGYLGSAARKSCLYICCQLGELGKPPPNFPETRTGAFPFACHAPALWQGRSSGASGAWGGNGLVDGGDQMGLGIRFLIRVPRAGPPGGRSLPG